MSIVEQPLAVLAPSSDAGEDRPRSGSTSRTVPPSSQYIEENDGGAGGRDLSTSLPFKDPTESPSQPKASTAKHGPIVYKELTPLVAMPPPSDAAVHSRLAKHGYSRLGRNLLFEARPAVRGGKCVFETPLRQSKHSTVSRWLSCRGMTVNPASCLLCRRL